jgi:hypothetical protein
VKSVGQNATLFPKSQNSASFISAQVHYLRQLEKLVSKVSKVALVTSGGRLRATDYLSVIDVT